MPLVNSDVRISQRALFERFALIYLPIVAILSLAVLLSVRFDEQGRLERREVREQSRVELASSQIARDYSVVDSDLHVIASLPSLQHYLGSGSPAWHDELVQLLLVLVKERRHYDQVRYLDASGQEVIRINYNGGNPIIVPREQLQNKSKRYFFRDTFRLGRGETYVSPLDLNVEHDQLEIPYKPMVRFGTPVFDGAGRKRGVILFNYLGAELLQDFRETMQGGDPREAMLLNRDGYWLSSPKTGDEWGFMLGKNDRTFGNDFAEEWRAISGSEHGVLHTAKGLFVYATVYPLLSGETSSTGSSLPQASSQHELKAHEYYWKVVSFVPDAALSGTTFFSQPGGRILLAAIYLLLALASWFIALITLSRRQARVELLEALAKAKRFADTMNEVPAYVYIKNKQHQYVYGNRLVLELFKCSAEELPGNGDAKFFPPEAVARLKEVDDRVLERGETTREEIDVAPGTPNHRVYWEVKHPIYDDQGEMWGICGISTDITERKKIEEALRKSSEEIEDLYDRAPCGYHSLDEHGLVVRMNRTELEWLGYSREEVIGKMRFPDLLTPASIQIFQGNFPRFLEFGYVHDLEFELIRKDGSRLPVLVSATAVRDAQGKFVMSRSTLFDLTERKKLERELERQARIDVLTGLNNRRHFFELAEHELARARRHGEALSALMLDVDHFKLFNDTYGHHVGDKVLQKLSAVCSQALREIDIFGRLGGEEFAILMPETNGAQALEAAERLRLAVANADVVLETGALIHFTVSIGVASFVATDTHVDTMLKRADAALYKAKNAGRNRVHGE